MKTVPAYFLIITALTALAQALKAIWDNSKWVNERPSALLMALVLLAAIFLLIRTKQRLAATLLISGGVSNLLDALRFGGVVDYWHIGTFWFNAADVIIACGTILLCLHVFWPQQSKE